MRRVTSKPIALCRAALPRLGLGALVLGFLAGISGAGASNGNTASGNVPSSGLVRTSAGAPARASTVTTTGTVNSSPLDLLSLPGNVNIALSIRGSAWSSREPSGRAARQMLEELAGDMGLPSAWDELWRTLELEPADAVDRLLGRHVLVAWRIEAQAPIGSEGEWVLLSLVDERIERRIRERLRPAPRDIQTGQAILSLEDGRYLLTTRRGEAALDGARPGQRAGTDVAVIMLAPSSRDALFREMLPRLAGVAQPAGSLADDARVRQRADLLSREIAMVTRAPSDGAAGPGVPQGREAFITMLGASWRRGEDMARLGPGLDARLVLIGADAAADGPGALTLADLDRASGPSAVVAMCDARPLTPRPGAQDARAGVLGVRAPVASPAEPISALLSLMDLDPSTRRSLGPRSLAIVHGTGERGDVLAFTMGVSVADLSVAAADLDHALADFLGDDETPGPDFGGRYPTAVRVAPIPQDSPLSLRAIFRQGAVLAWQYPSLPFGAAPSPGTTTPRPAPPTDGLITASAPAGPGSALPTIVPASAPTPAGQAAAPAGIAVTGAPPAHADDATRAPGWWLVRLAGDADTASDQVRAIGRVLSGASEDPSVRTSAIVRPARLLSAMAAAGIPFPPTMRVLRWVPRVSWETRWIAPGMTQTDLTLDLDPRMRAQP